MRSLALIASLATAATLGLAAPALAESAAQPSAQPSAQASRVTVTLGPDLQKEVDKLGQREVDEQVARLQTAVGDALAQSTAYPDATAVLVLKDLKPNRPTFEQTARTPGLDPIRSRSIGGASIEGEIITADGRRIPVQYSYSTSNLRDVVGYGVWWDANRTFDRFADRIENGRF